MTYDIIIIGAGPAGLTAALYACRAGKTVLVLERSTPGGQITASPLVENYPGVPAVSGAEFAMNLLEQVKDLGAQVKTSAAQKVRRDGELFIVETRRGQFTSRALIVATGSRHRELGIEREKELIGSGVSYCAVCDGAFFAGRTTVVVGGGNTALQDAVYLSARCEKVYLIHRRNEFRADAHLVSRVRDIPNIEIVTPAVVQSLNGEVRLESLTVRTGDETRTLLCDGLFVAVGQEPQNAPFADIVPLDESGYVDIDEGLCASPGVFVAGDCRKKALRQLTTAVGDGAQAGVAACEYLDKA